MESKRLTLQKSIQDMGFGRKLMRMPLVNAAIETMQMLLDGHPKAMKIRKVTIARYAASLIGHYRGKITLPKSKISSHEKLDNFIKLFVKRTFISNGKIQNIKLFTQLFGVDLLEERVSLNKVKHNPSPAYVLKYSIQKRPISDFQTVSNLKELRKMSIDNMKLLLTPRGKFNPKLSGLNQMRAQQHAITLTTKFAKTVNAGKRLALATLIEQLQKTEKLNRDLLQNIRKHST
tara:strand:- start:1051 stop:1749 length:699 start_codon:yes stop_codon:yes gene_type:complete